MGVAWVWDLCKLHVQDVDKARQRVVEQLCSIAAIKSVPASIKTQILKFLAVNSFFAVSSSAVGKVCLDSQPLATGCSDQWYWDSDS